MQKIIFLFDLFIFSKCNLRTFNLGSFFFVFSFGIGQTSKIHYSKNKTIIWDKGSFDQNSLDQNCVFSVDQKFHNQLIKFF